LVAFDASGNATVLFTKEVSAGSDWKDRVYSAERRAGHVFGSPVAISRAGERQEYTQLAVAPDGTAIALWRTWDNTSLASSSGGGPPLLAGGLYASIRSGGVWGDTIELYPSHVRQPAVAFGPSSTAVAIWSRVFGDTANWPPPGQLACAQIEASVWGEGAQGPFDRPGRACAPPVQLKA